MRRNLLLIVVALLVVLIPTEVVLRLQAARERERMRAGLGEHVLCTKQARDRRLIYTYVPGECGANSRGFRDVEHTADKPAGVFRIVLIGDSVAEGRDVPADSTFGRDLERMLNARGDSLRYEVILLARAGYSTSQELVLLEDEAPRYHPDLILWSYCLNDPAHPVYHNANGNLGRYYYRPRSYVAALVFQAAFRIKQKFRGENCPTEFHAFLHCAFRQEVRANIARIASDARKLGAPVAFVVHPIFEDAPSFATYSLTDVHAHLDRDARDAGMVPIDLLPAFRAFAPADLKINRDDYFDPWHLNVLGHRITASIIRDHLVATGLIPPRAPGTSRRHSP